MRKFLYILIPSLFLCLLVGVGYWAGGYVVAQKFERLIQWVEKGETLAGVLSITKLTEEQRSHYRNAYSNPSFDERNVSWSVPNQLTPFVGNAPVPGQHQNAYINSLQMRNQQELQTPKPKDTYRIFLTGGSTAFGSGAPSQERTIGALLGELLNASPAAKDSLRYEVFTLANPAWASTHERIAIENYLSELQPDLVISLSGNNDVFWGDAGRNVLWFNAFADDYHKSLINTAMNVTGRKGSPELQSTLSLAKPVPPETVARRIEKNIRLGSLALQENNVKWVFFLQPTLSVAKKPLTKRENDFVPASKNYYIECYKAIASKLSAVGSDNFEFVDLSAAFDKFSEQEDMFLDQFHFGDKGNVVIAGAIFSALSNQVKATAPRP